jgi:hypothetical protein
MYIYTVQFENVYMSKEEQEPGNHTERDGEKGRERERERERTAQRLLY